MLPLRAAPLKKDLAPNGTRSFLLAADCQQVQPSRSNRALAACHVFRRDALLVDSECDDTMAQPAIESDRSAFSAARWKWADHRTQLRFHGFREMPGKAAMPLPLR